MIVPVVARPPGAAPDLDEADASLEQATGEQASAAEIGGRWFIEAVELASGGSFASQVERLGRTELHPGGQLVGLDPG